MTNETTAADGAVTSLLRKQGGLITRRQLLEAGWTDAKLRHRTRPDGPWRAVLPGIYLNYNGPLAIGQRELAATLYGGPGCVITGQAALQRLGVRVPPTDVIDVLIPITRKRQTAGFVRTHRTTRMPERGFVIDGIRWALAARAVADSARGDLELREVRDLVASAVQGDKCTVGQLASELREGPNRDSVKLRSVLQEVADGIASAAEGDLHALVKRFGLPEPMYNPDLYAGSEFLGRPDVYWPDAGVAGEVDSQEWHLLPGHWAKTMERHRRMSAAGIIVVHFAPKQLKTDGKRIGTDLQSTIEAGRRRPRLEIRAVPNQQRRRHG